MPLAPCSSLFNTSHRVRSQKTPFSHLSLSLAMMGATFTRGSRVEVSSDDVGFTDAWYVATMVDAVEASSTKKASNKTNKNRKKSGYLVKYDTLFEEGDLSVPLTEIVDASFVRPLPPPFPRRINDINDSEADGGDFELYDVVDTYYLDGWWTGVVTKVIVDGDRKRFIVSFENPPEEYEFEKAQLRLHLDWIDCHWWVPPKKTPEQASVNRNATRTSKSNNNAHSSFTTPLKSVLTADYSDNQTVGARVSAKRKSRLWRKSETSAKTVGAVDGSLTYSSNKRFDYVEENSRAKRLQSSSVGKGNTKMEASISQAVCQDSLLSGQGMLITESGEAKDGRRQHKRKRGRPRRFLVNQPNGLLEDNQEAGKRDSSAINEMASELDEQPLSVWYQGLHPPTVLNNPRVACCSALDHCDEPSAALNPIVDNGEALEKHQELPFIKSSPIWATIESLKLYQKPPQKPHFSPLKNVKEDYREGLAIGHMVTYGNVVERASKFQLHDPSDVIQSSLETLVDLESHGFDVGAVRVRLSELLCRKTKVGQLEDESKEVEIELEKRNLEKSMVQEEINQLEGKMKELQNNIAQAVTTKNTKDEEILKLQSRLQLIADQITVGKHDFEKLAAAPL